MVATPETFISFLWDTIDNKIIFLLIILFLMLSFFYYVKHKAQSGFSIANRIFMFFIRNKESKEIELIDEIIDIERFNFYYNTRAISLRQTIAFEKWIRKYELDFRIISKLKSRLDIDNLKISKVNKYILIAFIVSSLLACVLCLQTFIISNTNSLLIKFDGSDWFWVNKNEARLFSILEYKNAPWVLTDKSCKANTTNTSLSPEHIAIICNFLDNHKGLPLLNAQIKEQKLFFFILTVFLSIFSVLLIRTWTHMTYAMDARSMVYRKIKKLRQQRWAKRKKI